MRLYEVALLVALAALIAAFCTLKSLPPADRCPARGACCGCK